MEDAALQLVRGEAEAPLERAGQLQELIDGAYFAGAVPRIGIAEKTVAREGHAVAQAAAENLAYRRIPGLAENIQAGEFQRGQRLRAVVIQGGGGVGDEEPHLFETRRIVTNQVGFHGAEHRFGRFAAAAHFAQTDQAIIRLHFHNGADKAAPMAAVGVTQGSFERNRHGGRANILDFHN